MELTDEMIEEIRRGARQVEYGKVVIDIETRGNEQSVDIVVTARRRFQKAMPGKGGITLRRMAGLILL
jgi:hypothetical protein